MCGCQESPRSSGVDTGKVEGTRMHRYGLTPSVILTVGSLVAVAHGDGPFDGEWRTTIATVTLKQQGNNVTGTYGNANQFTLKGTVAANALTFEFQEGTAKGDGRFTLDETGNAFNGGFQIRG